MTVYARGYRGYNGEFKKPAAPRVFAGEALRIAFSRKSFKRIGAVYLMWFSMCLFFLYVVMGTDVGEFLKAFEKMVEGADPAPDDLSLAVLDQVLRAFYVGVALLTALLSIFIGSSLVSDDLGTGALPLYLVRPIRPWEYVAGKALVLPAILFVAFLVPGLLFYLIVGVWQRPGETWSFLTAHADVLGAIFQSYLIAAASYTGLMLLMSSLTPRRSAVAVMSGVLVFAGVLLGSLPRTIEMSSKLGAALLLFDLPRNTVVPFLWRVRRYEKEVSWERIPESGTVVVLALAILAVGLWAAWRRARSVEVVA